MEKIHVGILGWGNLGRGVELAITNNPDFELSVVFSRRKQSHPLFVEMDRILDWKDKLDVLLLCGGSATDLPDQTPQMAEHFHVVDSFDTHPRIPEHFAAVDRAARKGDKLALISTGWDPGLFSLMRALFEAVLPGGREYTFWGKGISQGHSSAIRNIPGVRDGKQYTIPSETALAQIRSGVEPDLSSAEKHKRVCYVVADTGADTETIRQAIVTMPNYFVGYDTTVHFISQEELDRDHQGLPHGGSVLRSGKTGDNTHLMEFTLRLDSNPEFTANVMVATARAVHRLAAAGERGARTLYDLPIGLLSPHSPETLRKNSL